MLNNAHVLYPQRIQSLAYSDSAIFFCVPELKCTTTAFRRSLDTTVSHSRPSCLAALAIQSNNAISYIDINVPGYCLDI